MSEHETVRVKCYPLIIEAVMKDGDTPIDTAIGGLRNEEGNGHPQGPFALYRDGDPVPLQVCIDKGDKQARTWRVSVDNLDGKDFPVFHAEKEIDIRKTDRVTFVISGDTGARPPRTVRTDTGCSGRVR